MKVVILAGGFGTRISEESHLVPKPMIEIGGMPILWHIMKIYSHYGFHEFIICAGYKQNVIKEWFSHYYLYTSNITFDFSDKNKVIVHNTASEPWKVTVVDTGLETATGGRVRRIQPYVGDEQFCLTYGDAVSDVDLGELLKFHRSHRKCMTLTAVRFAQQKGVLEIDGDNMVRAFREKSDEDETMINGGFMVCQPDLFNYLEGDAMSLEGDAMGHLAQIGELKSFNHRGFWQCMDTQREKLRLEEMWARGSAPWKVWDD